MGVQYFLCVFPKIFQRLESLIEYIYGEYLQFSYDAMSLLSSFRSHHIYMTLLCYFLSYMYSLL